MPNWRHAWAGSHKAHSHEDAVGKVGREDRGETGGHLGSLWSLRRSARPATRGHWSPVIVGPQRLAGSGNHGLKAQRHPRRGRVVGQPKRHRNTSKLLVSGARLCAGNDCSPSAVCHRHVHRTRYSVTDRFVEQDYVPATIVRLRLSHRDVHRTFNMRCRRRARRLVA